MFTSCFDFNISVHRTKPAFQTLHEAAATQALPLFLQRPDWTTALLFGLPVAARSVSYGCQYLPGQQVAPGFLTAPLSLRAVGARYSRLSQRRNAACYTLQLLLTCGAQFWTGDSGYSPSAYAGSGGSCDTRARNEGALCQILRHIWLCFRNSGVGPESSVWLNPSYEQSTGIHWTSWALY